MHHSFCSYGLRYQYGLFRQVILDGFQHEQPDYWLNFGNPWEIERVHVSYPVKVCKYFPILFLLNTSMFTVCFIQRCLSFIFSKFYLFSAILYYVRWISSMGLLKRKLWMEKVVKFGYLEKRWENNFFHILKQLLTQEKKNTS